MMTENGPWHDNADDYFDKVYGKLLAGPTDAWPQQKWLLGFGRGRRLLISLFGLFLAGGDHPTPEESAQESNLYTYTHYKKYLHTIDFNLVRHFPKQKDFGGVSFSVPVMSERSDWSFQSVPVVSEGDSICHRHVGGRFRLSPPCRREIQSVTVMSGIDAYRTRLANGLVGSSQLLQQFGHTTLENQESTFGTLGTPPRDYVQSAGGNNVTAADIGAWAGKLKLWTASKNSAVARVENALRTIGPRSHLNTKQLTVDPNSSLNRALVVMIHGCNMFEEKYITPIVQVSVALWSLEATLYPARYMTKKPRRKHLCACCTARKHGRRGTSTRRKGTRPSPKCTT